MVIVTQCFLMTTRASLGLQYSCGNLSKSKALRVGVAGEVMIVGRPEIRILTGVGEVKNGISRLCLSLTSGSLSPPVPPALQFLL